MGRTIQTASTLGGTDMTSFRDSSATRAVLLPSINGAVTYYMTGKVPGAIDPAGTYHDYADAYSTTFANSVFNKLSAKEPYDPAFTPTAVFAPGNGRKAILHRITITAAATDVVIELPTDSGTTVVLLEALNGSAGRVYDFSPGFFLPDGFRVKINGTATTGRVLVVYSLLEN